LRFDTPVYFQHIQQGEYNTTTGNYDSDTLTENERYANVSDTGTKTMNLVYGELRQGSFVVRLQNHYTQPFDQIRIGDKRYRVDHKRSPRNKQTFVVSEVQ